jgi:hypothetical protein
MFMYLVGQTITEKIIENTMGRIFTAGEDLNSLESFLKRWNKEHESNFFLKTVVKFQM